MVGPSVNWVKKAGQPDGVAGRRKNRPESAIGAGEVDFGHCVAPQSPLTVVSASAAGRSSIRYKRRGSGYQKIVGSRWQTGSGIDALRRDAGPSPFGQ